MFELTRPKLTIKSLLSVKIEASETKDKCHEFLVQQYDRCFVHLQTN